ncbi:hypothetical protein [Oceanobacillus halophilus]|uniref:Transcriptional regulator n=1 Tax=Oceanobacillus halophilus TaxID=930130 RepID=A0A495A237_9BACI|nr:hypothetical protein [Oceanobacillus halophilus]RKQ33446.1 hypothetical protein D8M06_09555 [Oceanobacillus halophilus]
MNVKIAVFGRNEVITRFSKLTDQQNDVEMVRFIYEQEEETIQLIEKAFMCDIYVFTEPLSYLYVKQKVEKKRLPVVQVPQDELMVLRSFYQLKNTQIGKRLSVDVENEKSVKNVMQEIEGNFQNIHIYDYGLDSKISIDDIANFHINLWKNGKIDYVLTSVKSVEKLLKEQDIPVSTMDIPEINFEKTITYSKSKLKLDLSKSAQVVTGYIQIKNDKENQQKLQTAMNKLRDILEKFSKKTDVSVFQISNHQIVLFGTKALINHLTNHYRDFPLLREIKSEVNVPVDIGYGLGLTAKQSEVNAKIAVETCSKTEDSKCYIVNERQETIGPIGVKKEFDASRLYHALIHNARLNNELSYNFIDFIRTRNNEPFSSNDIANYYNVTKRSAERTVNKLLNGEVIKVSGEERPYQKGRPRKLFTLNQ